MRCGVCGGTARKGTRVYVLRAFGDARPKLTRATACADCFGDALHVCVQVNLFHHAPKRVRKAGRAARWLDPPEGR
jgi:hypothetical protein